MLLAKIGAKICCCSQLASHASIGKIKKSELFSHIFAPFFDYSHASLFSTP
jgi:hypothetical protein